MAELIDLHTHILPDIDNGPKDPFMSADMLKSMHAQGVKKLFLTPHFYTERQTLSRFLARRDTSFRKFSSEAHLKKIGIDIRLGMEVQFSPSILGLELKDLVLDGTRYILVGFSSMTPPPGAGDILREILKRDYIPILSHVERLSFLKTNPILLYNWVCDGCLAQVNSGSLGLEVTKNFMERGLVHLIASDAHNTTTRKPDLKAGLARLPLEDREYYMANAAAVWNNQDVTRRTPIEPTKAFFGKWI